MKLIFLFTLFICSHSLSDKDLIALITRFKSSLQTFLSLYPSISEIGNILQQQGLSRRINLTKSSTRSPIKTEDATPVIQMHGMGDFAKDPAGMVPFAKEISAYLGGAYVLNIQIGDNFIEDILNGFIMNLDDQVDYFAKVVQGDAKLANGFNAVGYSQGNIIIRGYIERYNNPPVLNFISMHGTLAGVGGFPHCSVDQLACRELAEILGNYAYKPFVQEHLAQANYFRDPKKIEEYLAGDRFLVDINSEIDQTTTNATTYRSNFASLNSLCLVKANGDTMVIPNDSEWFGAFVDGTFSLVWSFTQTPWYRSDYFGLKTLDSQKKVFFNTTDGDHLQFETDYLLDLIGIYFV